MMKNMNYNYTKNVTGILIIGPSAPLNPLTTEEYPTFLIPLLNKSLLEINLRWLAQCSQKIVIIVVKPYLTTVQNLINYLKDTDSIPEQNNPQKFDNINFSTIKFHAINEYSGSFHEIARVKTDDEILLITKSDIYTTINPNNIVEEFKKSKTSLITVLRDDDSEFIVGHSQKKLIYYGKDFKDQQNNIFLNTCNIEFNCKKDVGQIYVAHKSVFDEKIGMSFSKNILPDLVNKFRFANPVALFKTNELVYRVSNVQKYININAMLNSTEKINSIKHNKYLAVKKTIFNFDVLKNILNQNKIIVNEKVTFGEGCIIKSSIILPGAVIGSNTIIENCIVGMDVVIIDGSKMKNCVIGCGYKFEENVVCEDKQFNNLSL